MIAKKALAVLILVVVAAALVKVGFAIPELGVALLIVLAGVAVVWAIDTLIKEE